MRWIVIILLMTMVSCSNDTVIPRESPNELKRSNDYQEFNEINKSLDFMNRRIIDLERCAINQNDRIRSLEQRMSMVENEHSILVKPKNVKP